MKVEVFIEEYINPHCQYSDKTKVVRSLGYCICDSIRRVVDLYEKDYKEEMNEYQIITCMQVKETK